MSTCPLRWSKTDEIDLISQLHIFFCCCTRRNSQHSTLIKLANMESIASLPLSEIDHELSNVQKSLLLILNNNSIDSIVQIT